ncbi:MAG: hypothetical protein CSB55_01560 [Candidatus Cloacimonadota bacterium]|nr:MAG: hypothetical protein CSB55_01560 [Candidatus Cloacimonadota bacterium]
MAEKIELRISKKADEIIKIQTEVDDYRYRYDLDSDSVYKLNFVLESLIMQFISTVEIPENSEETPDEILIIKFTVFEEDIMINFIDEGEAFNPLDTPAKTIEEAVEKEDYNSLGVLLSQNYITEAEYSRKDGKNLLQIFVEVEEDF